MKTISLSRIRPGLAQRPKVAVVIPALNEERSIGSVLGELPKDLVDQIIVADNGSTDGTAEIASRQGAEVVHEPERGYGAACLRGLSRVRQEIEVIVFLDGDYSDYPEELSMLIEPILSGRADMVIGS